MSHAKYEQAFGLAMKHHQAGRLVEAEAGYRQAMALRPDRADAMQLLGVVLSQTGRATEGIALLRRAIAMSPLAAGYYSNLGFALANNGFKSEAVEAFARAVELGPENVDARGNLANALRETGRLDEAIVEYQEVLRRAAPSAQMMNNLGLALQDRGRMAEAIGCYRRAIAVKPDSAELFTNLANALFLNGERGESEAASRQAILLRPDHAVAWYNLGNTLQDQRRIDEAIEAYRKAVALQPGFAEAHHNLGNALREGRRLEEAIEQYRAAQSLGFDGFELRSNFGVTLKDMGDLDGAINWFERALELKADRLVESNLIYTLHFHPDATPESLCIAHARWNERYAKPLAGEKAGHPNDPTPERQLRIGYVSPDFRVHPVGFFLGPLLSHHDHAKFEIFCYSDVKAPDATTARLRGFADVWRETGRLSDERLAETIHADRIDVLVDLTMHMAASRLLAFARKPAPLQVTYLAYCSTTGVDAMDYRLSDPYLDPHSTGSGQAPGADEAMYSEKTVRLPRTYWCYQTPGNSPEVGPLPAAKAGFVTFGCLNNYCKVTRSAFDAWCEILRRVPNSRLIIHADEGGHRQRAGDLLAAAGVDPARLEFAGFVPLGEYLKMYQRIDIALDPFPYTGGTTSCDALWMGAPVVSLAGKTAVSRGGLSILSNMGMVEMVARDTEQYVQIAAELAGDLNRLTEFRAGLRQRMLRSPLADAPAFARDVENAYRDMWRNWCRQVMAGR